MNNIDGISGILNDNKFDSISNNNGVITAQRGSHFATIVISGEPRRWYHKIEIKQNSITYVIDTWFGIFTPADSEVFTEEAKILSSLINGTEPDYNQLIKRNRFRLLADIGVFVNLVGLSFFVGYLFFYSRT
jgi:hypothetical protein